MKRAGTEIRIGCLTPGHIFLLLYSCGSGTAENLDVSSPRGSRSMNWWLNWYFNCFCIFAMIYVCIGTFTKNYSLRSEAWCSGEITWHAIVSIWGQILHAQVKSVAVAHICNPSVLGRGRKWNSENSQKPEGQLAYCMQ